MTHQLIKLTIAHEADIVRSITESEHLRTENHRKHLEIMRDREGYFSKYLSDALNFFQLLLILLLIMRFL